MSTESRPASGKLDAWFSISARGSSVRQEILAGLTTFLAMVYSVIVVPGMLGKAGFPPLPCLSPPVWLPALVPSLWACGPICRWRLAVQSP